MTTNAGMDAEKQEQLLTSHGGMVTTEISVGVLKLLEIDLL